MIDMMSEDELRYLLSCSGLTQSERDEICKTLRRLERARHLRTQAYADMLYGGQVRGERARHDKRRGALTIVNTGTLTEVNDER